MMQYTGLAFDGVVLWIALTPFYKYCLIDSNTPNTTPKKSSVRLSKVPAVLLGVLAASPWWTGTPLATQYAMGFLGLIYGAAYFDPTTIRRKKHEKIASFWLRCIHEKIRKIIFSKIVSAIIALVSCYTFPQYWNYIGLFLVYQLLYYKMATCIENDSGVSVLIAPIEIKRKWALKAVPAAIIMGLLLIDPFQVLKSTQYVPDSWTAFAGLGIGSLWSLVWLAFIATI